MERCRGGAGIWAGALALGFALFAARDAARARGEAAPIDPAPFALGAEPGRMSARELRVLPGIGERLALAVVAARRAGASDWEDVPGIGPRTAARVRAWLAAHGRATELRARGRPP